MELEYSKTLVRLIHTYLIILIFEISRALGSYSPVSNIHYAGPPH